MGPKKIVFSDETYRRRAQTLQDVDETVSDMLDLLDKADQLGNTYVIFSSDQRYHLGNHWVDAGLMRGSGPNFSTAVTFPPTGNRRSRNLGSGVTLSSLSKTLTSMQGA